MDEDKSVQLIDDLLEDILSKEEINKLCTHAGTIARKQRTMRHIASTVLATAFMSLVILLSVHDPESGLPKNSPLIASPGVTISPEKTSSYLLVHSRPGGVSIVRTEKGSATIVSTKQNFYKLDIISDEELLLLFAERSPRLEVDEIGRKKLIFTN